MAITLKAMLTVQDRMTAPMRKVASQLDRVTKATNYTRDAQGRLRDEYGRFVGGAGKSAPSTLGGISKALAGVATSAGITAIALSTIKKGMDFEAQMSKVGAIAGASSTELKKLKDSAMQLGADTTKSASEVAVSMQELAAKGFDTNKIIGAMPGIIKAAEASGTELATTSDVITSALNAFNMKAEASTHIADVMAMAANKTAAGVEDMGFSFKYAAPVANTLGIGLEELASATGLMIDKGLAGEQAGTALRMGLMRLSDAPKEAQKAMDAMGFSAIDSAGKFKSIGQITDELRKKTEGMTDAQKVQTMSTIFGAEAATGWLGLIDSAPGKLDKMTDALVNSNGTADKTAKEMLDNAKGAVELLQGSLETLQLKLDGDLLPVLKEGATTFSEWVDNLDPEAIQGWADKIAGGAQKAIDFATMIKDNWPLVEAAVAGLTTAFILQKSALLKLVLFETVAAFLKAYRNGATLAAAAQAALNFAMSANPIGLVIIAIAGLVAGAVLLVKHWDYAKEKTRQLWDKLGAFKGVAALVMSPLGQIIRTAVTMADNWVSTKSVWENVWNGIKLAASNSVNEVVESINTMIGWINKIPGVNVPLVAKVDWGEAKKLAEGKTKYGKTTAGGFREMSAAGGLSYVPSDGTIINAHKGERVLTKAENEAYTSGKGGGNTYNMNITMNGSGSTRQDAKELMRYFVQEIEMAGNAGA